MNISLKHKTAIIGGCSRGIGEGVARVLAKAGASVILMSRNKEALRQLKEDLPCIHSKQKHELFLVDFNNHKDFQKKVDVFFKEHKVDILVNNTQGPKGGSALDKKIDDYQEAFDLLFKNHVYITKKAIEHMIAQKWGRIINIASISVKEPLNYLVLSNSIRAALTTWAKSMAIDLGPFNITVNNTLTGYFDTQRIAELNQKKAEKLNIKASEVRDQMIANVPLKRLGTPEEYGNLVCFLASEQASYINGANIPIDGGLLKSL